MKPQYIIDNWFNWFKNIDFDNLDKTHYWFVRIRTNDLAPLLEGQEKATENREMIFAAMLKLQAEWKQQLDKRVYDYRLEIWLVWPEFIESQVVASIKDRITRYEKLYEPATPQKPFPTEFFKSISGTINSMQWVYSQQFDTYWESYYTTGNKHIRDIDMKMYVDEMEHYKSLLELNQYHIMADENGKLDKLFYIKRNDVWVGQIG
jgi:hypothetical protein